MLPSVCNSNKRNEPIFPVILLLAIKKKKKNKDVDSFFFNLKEKCVSQCVEKVLKLVLF